MTPQAPNAAEPQDVTASTRTSIPSQTAPSATALVPAAAELLCVPAYCQQHAKHPPTFDAGTAGQCPCCGCCCQLVRLSGKSATGAAGVDSAGHSPQPPFAASDGAQPRQGTGSFVEALKTTSPGAKSSDNVVKGSPQPAVTNNAEASAESRQHKRSQEVVPGQPSEASAYCRRETKQCDSRLRRRGAAAATTLDQPEVPFAETATQRTHSGTWQHQDAERHVRRQTAPVKAAVRSPPSISDLRRLHAGQRRNTSPAAPPHAGRRRTGPPVLTSGADQRPRAGRVSDGGRAALQQRQLPVRRTGDVWPTDGRCRTMGLGCPAKQLTSERDALRRRSSLSAAVSKRALQMSGSRRPTVDQGSTFFAGGRCVNVTATMPALQSHCNTPH